MPDPQRLLTLLHRAAAYFRQTPGRRGHVIHLTDADDVCVAGDLHGNLENLRALLKTAELASRPRRHLALQEVIHGQFRYPAGGDKSHQALDVLAALKCQFPDRVHFLPGNHELAQWTESLIGKGDEDLNGIFRQGVDAAYGSFAAEIYAAYMGIIAASPLAVRTPNRVYICHSVPAPQHLDRFDPAVLEQDEYQPDDLRLGGTVHSLVWGRTVTEEHVAAFLTKVDADWLITGHLPQPLGFAAPNSRQIILDSQASPACYCLFPCDRPILPGDLNRMVGTLN